MEHYRKLIVRDFNEHIVPDASGRHIQLFQFDASPFQPKDFRLVFNIKTTYYSSVYKEMIIDPKEKEDKAQPGNISHCETIEVPTDKNLYIRVEKLIDIPKTILPMDIRYQILN